MDTIQAVIRLIESGLVTQGTAVIISAPMTEPRSVLRDRLADLVARYAATLDPAEIQRLTGHPDEPAEFAAMVALGEDLLLLADVRRDEGWLRLTRRLCVLGG